MTAAFDSAEGPWRCAACGRWCDARGRIVAPPPVSHDRPISHGFCRPCQGLWLRRYEQDLRDAGRRAAALRAARFRLGATVPVTWEESRALRERARALVVQSRAIVRAIRQARRGAGHELAHPISALRPWRHWHRDEGPTGTSEVA